MKDIIFYHRAYRKAAIPGKRIFFESLFLPLPLLITVLFLYPEITSLMNRFARAVLLSSFPFESIAVINKPYMISEVHIIGLLGKHPSPLLSFLLFLFSLSCICIIPKIRMPTPIKAWVIFVSSINIISSVFFIVTPFIFPYDIETFSELYVKTEVGIWFIVPIIMGMALLLLPSNALSKFAVAALTLLYSIIFGILRYIVFLYVLKKFSYLFMPLLYFALGPLMDFTYVVAIYSLYGSIIARRKNNRAETGIWQWS